MPAGTSSSALVAGFDLYATFAALAGAALPADRAIDGKNITPLMVGEANVTSPHEAFYYYQGDGLVAVRQERWKLVVARPPDVKDDGAMPLLFDLEADLGETRNVAAAHPDVVERLQAIAERAREDLGDARTKRTGRNVREPGRAGPEVQELRLIEWRAAVP